MEAPRRCVHARALVQVQWTVKDIESGLYFDMCNRCFYKKVAGRKGWKILIKGGEFLKTEAERRQLTIIRDKEIPF